MSHHPHSPSTIHRRLSCSYSGVIEPHMPNRTNAMAEEGTMLHERLEVSNFNNLTDEQIRICEWAQDAVTNVLEEFGRPLEFHRELKMELLSNDGDVITYGTADIVLVYDDHVVVLDYKMGFGFVSADNNKQLWVYSLMAMQMFDKDVSYGYIIQPRCDYVGYDCWNYSPESIDYIDEALKACETATPVDATPSTSACKYCSAKLEKKCPALNEYESEIVKYESFDVMAMTPEECAEYLRKMDLVRGLFESMEREMMVRFEEKGDLDDLFEQKQHWKAGTVSFSEVQDQVTIEDLLKKGFTVTQKQFEDAYVARHKQGVRGEVAPLRETAVRIYKDKKKGKATKGKIEIKRRK